MKDREFCYWLMGLFELGEPKEITANQVVVIEQHLKLVLTNTEDEIKIPIIFWLEGFLESKVIGGIDNRDMNVIIARLQKVFKHVIDLEPSKEQQANFNNIHNGPSLGDDLMRC